MTKMLFIFSLNLLVVSSCHEHNAKKVENKNLNLCDKITDDSVITLKGIVNISSENEIIFEDMKSSENWQRKIKLIPCSNYLNKYIFNYYDSYLYLKNFDEKLWISVEGKFLRTDTLKSSQQFLFNSVVLIDELEAKTDSSQALREINREQLDSMNRNK